MAHVATKALGYQHGCEVDPNANGEEEKKDNQPEVPKMQQNAKAGNNNTNPGEKKADDPKVEEEKKEDDKPQEEDKPEEDKPKEDILPTLMKILEDEELRKLI